MLNINICVGVTISFFAVLDKKYIYINEKKGITF